MRRKTTPDAETDPALPPPQTLALGELLGGAVTRAAEAVGVARHGNAPRVGSSDAERVREDVARQRDRARLIFSQKESVEPWTVL